jgi:hypothetical protein
MFPKARVIGDTPAIGPVEAEDTVLDHAEVMFGPGFQYVASGLNACTL